jgi:hypothetical protein
MGATACADSLPLLGTRLPKVRTTAQRSYFGDIAVVTFLLVQCLDGVFTYVGVRAFGLGIEGNPVVAALMAHLGHEVGLLSAKVMAGVLGICLHIHQVHLAVAVLTGFYLAAAIAPWSMILFF